MENKKIEDLNLGEQLYILADGTELNLWFDFDANKIRAQKVIPTQGGPKIIKTGYTNQFGEFVVLAERTVNPGEDGY